MSHQVWFGQHLFGKAPQLHLIVIAGLTTTMEKDDQGKWVFGAGGVLAVIASVFSLLICVAFSLCYVLCICSCGCLSVLRVVVFRVVRSSVRVVFIVVLSLS